MTEDRIAQLFGRDAVQEVQRHAMYNPILHAALTHLDALMDERAETEPVLADRTLPGWYIVQVQRGESETITNIWPVDGEGVVTDTLAMPALIELFDALSEEGPADPWEPVDAVRSRLDQAAGGEHG